MANFLTRNYETISDKCAGALMCDKKPFSWLPHFWPNPANPLQNVIRYLCIEWSSSSLIRGHEFEVNVPLNQKMQSALLSFDFVPFSFITLKSPGPYHWAVWRLVNGSFWKHHDSSLVTMFCKRFRLSSTHSLKLCDDSKSWSFCSPVMHEVRILPCTDTKFFW